MKDTTPDQTRRFRANVMAKNWPGATHQAAEAIRCLVQYGVYDEINKWVKRAEYAQSQSRDARARGGGVALHINDQTEDAIRRLLPYTTIVNDWDCGNVWGEPFEEGCRPHVTISNPTARVIEVLVAHRIGYIITELNDWSKDKERDDWGVSACAHTDGNNPADKE